jgi:uncharacterized damage-inducible protein DinB
MARGAFITTEGMLERWQGNRRLTRRVIEAFPESELFTFSVSGMRTFGALANEMLGMGAPMLRGAVTGEWEQYSTAAAADQVELLRQWDASTAEIDTLWQQLPPERFAETMTAFGVYTDELQGLLSYVIENEIHHRGQGYVYLRALAIEPPPFWER